MIRLWDVRVSMHPFFVIIMLASLVTGHFIELITLFAIVFIHECGHAAAAALLGCRVVSIQMLPFGGVAVIEDGGKLTAWREIAIALAGPLQNIFMVGVVLLLQYMQVGDPIFLSYIIQGNLLIALFNLLPILPLDGGKIVQALVSLIAPYYTTLMWTYRISILVSIGVIVYAVVRWIAGDYGLPLNILLVGLFLFYSNVTDYRNIPYRFIRFLMNREGAFVHHAAMGSLAQPIISFPAKPLDTILRLLKRERYHMVYVMNQQGRILAVLPEQRIISSYFKQNADKS
ncbi:Zn-dependent protease [Paenibacillus sp. Root52]|uniref:Stage IV sporulation protein FB n=1 Tax=Paenibacillus amylolyticus TaxID=1451 RepID=A0AAP5H8U8_PAEAM|nr:MULTISPECIES: M50 family metallopeptidase [Paenibacillus]KQY85175.1 Zn-dependent protease [Paenibacillus sp. Root52]MDR6727345.1 stage IV sporulation protein FB [Paenibacillus amylolyticus]